MQNSILTRGTVQIDQSEITLSTGNTSLQMSRLWEIVTGTENFLSEKGTEGSAAKLTGLAPGVYQIEVSLYSRELEYNDSLYAWNGKRFVKVTGREGATQQSSTVWVRNWFTTTIEVVYDYITFVALDVFSKIGNTEFKIRNLQYLSPLPYLVPEPISLIPTKTIGNVQTDRTCQISTATGARAISTLSQELTGDRSRLNGYGVEGSLAIWNNLLPGIYEVKWQISTSETEKDAIYVWADETLTLWGIPSQATNPLSSTRKISNLITIQIRVANGTLGFLALDTVDTTGTTELHIHQIERIAEIFEEIEGNGNNSANTAWFLGTLYPEGFEPEGIIWNNGEISGSDHSGYSEIIETIGGDDVVDFFTFHLAMPATLRLTTNNAIAALLNEQANSVIWDFNDAYQSEGTIRLNPGTYYLQYSTESSMPEEFNSTLYLTP
ncbi:hypothetical protein [Laspinema olomoucense]|uniref:hypothetical protein n=1 Tax=Laspinema olomoucense TaxID=3231600 RepID=UPI0021BB706A|nr:hypothetical protein [Laspinema sp. D3c]MCT7992535.1 hypothetical protein [Laspinema sp. D3c]